MKIEKNSTEIIQEYMVYYLNGERFASSTMQGGKRAYTIENYDRRLYVENSKDIFSKEKENILDKLDIGTLMYENLVHSLKVVGTVKRVLISMILQKHKYVFEKEKTDMINNVFAEVNVTYMKVLIVDADPQSDVSAGFGYRDCDESNETLTALMDTVMKDEDIPSDCYIRHQAEGIDIICSNIGLAGTEVQLVNAMSREYVLKQILYGIKDQYDAIIIDCMPSLGMITINALAASDEVLIPVEASYLPIKGLQQLLKTIGKVRKQINPKLQVGGILFTMVDAHTNDARNNMELLRNVYGSQIHIFDNYIPFSVRMKEAVREGQSIFSYDPKGKATEAYRRVTEEVLKDAI